MRIAIATAFLLALATSASGQPNSGLVGRISSWPCWRGPSGDNHAPEGTKGPIRWDLSTGHNIVWKTLLPGRGHSSPVVVGDAIFLTTAERQEKTQSLLKIDRESGRLMDKWVVHRGTLPLAIHANNSYATPTPASDGEYVFVAFDSDDAIWVTAMTTTGREVWKKRVCEFIPDQFQYGYGASPLIEEDVVIIAAEYDGQDSGLYALDRATGNTVWTVERPVNLSFASPIAATIAGQRQVMLAGAGTIAAYDPQSGRQFWSVETATDAICGTVVWDDRRIIVSGGTPKAGTWCIRGDGSEVPIWENTVMCYEQSLLAIRNYVFGVADTGVAYCWRTRDGGLMWKKRLFEGGISASPLLVGDRVYIPSQSGTVYVIAASPNRCDLLAENPSGDSLFASPVAIDDRIYFRTGIGVGEERKEFLVAAGSLTLEAGPNQ